MAPEISDRVDDFEIDFDEIEEATDEDLMDFFQRLQSGLQLNASEKLNAVPSKLKTFCKKMAKHEFFARKVAFGDKRYAHFDVVAKVATLEVEGIGAGLRYTDVRSVFEAQKNFSEQSEVARRITMALDFLASAFPDGSKTFRSRSLTQSLVTMTCHLMRNDALQAMAPRIGKFAESFVDGLAEEVEKGQRATDADFIAFQKSINANIKSGPIERHKVLLRKLFESEPDFLEVADADGAASADFSDKIGKVAREIREMLTRLNDNYAAQHGTDFFKATNKTASAQSAIGEKINSYDGYKSLIEHLYFLFWEGPGSRLLNKPESYRDINILRTELQHDTDHGDTKSVEKKKIKHGEVFKRYCGATSPSVAAPARFTILQLNLLKALKESTLLLLGEAETK